MSRAAQELEQKIKAMLAEGKKAKPQKQERIVENPEDSEKVLTSEAEASITDTNLSKQGEEYLGNSAETSPEQPDESRKTVATKKKTEKKPKAPKAAKTPKAPKAVKAAAAPKERKSRIKVVSGKLQSVEPMGTTYIGLTFEEGKIVLTPTGNRETNRDIAVKALRALL